MVFGFLNNALKTSLIIFLFSYSPIILKTVAKMTSAIGIVQYNLSVCLGLTLASMVLGKVIVINIIISATSRLAAKSDTGPNVWPLLNVNTLKNRVAARKDIAKAKTVLDTFNKARYGPLYSISEPEAI